MIFLALSALLAVLTPAGTWSNLLPAYHAPALRSFEALGLAKTNDANRDGSSIASAVVITAKTEVDGITAEHDYIAKQPCANGGTWLWTKQSVRAAGPLKYDQIDTKCSASDDVRTFFFDITSFFGRLGD